MKLPVVLRRHFNPYGIGARVTIDARFAFASILIAETILAVYMLVFGFPGLLATWRRRLNRIDYIDVGTNVDGGEGSPVGVEVDTALVSFLRSSPNDTMLINRRGSPGARSECGGRKGILILVNSAPRNVEARDLVRRTWKRSLLKDGDVQVRFFVGISPAGIPPELGSEAERNQDMIIEHFVDSYTNLTLKSVLMLKWVTMHCGSSLNFYAKFDDDTFINPENLLKVLDARKGVKNVMLGNLICEATVVRKPGHKYYIPKEVYSESKYPSYLSGTGYVISADLVPHLYRLALRSPLFPMEDVFISGFLRRQLNIEPTGHEGFVFCLDPTDAQALLSSVLVHCLSMSEKKFAWETLESRRNSVPVSTSGWTCDF